MSDTVPKNPTPSSHGQVAGEYYDKLAAYFGDFADDLRDTAGIVVDLTYHDLMNAAESLAFDLNRYKLFHEIDIPDRARSAAYICKWIMRFRPVALIQKLEELPKEKKQPALLINELYCLYVISGVLGIDFEGETTDRFSGIVLYSLRYRAHSEDTFILLLAKMCGI